TDVVIAVNELKRVKANLYQVISEHTGQSFEKVAQDSERDCWMLADEAKEYGLIDEVLKVNPNKSK
nr:ATP-dependent Clp protease proteolytic subunit [Flavipsychrobacter sp.]